MRCLEVTNPKINSIHECLPRTGNPTPVIHPDPLKLASHAGLLLSLGSLLLILYIAYAWVSGQSIQGWTSLMLVVVVLGAVQMFVLALMGEYIGRLYNEAKGRPLYIVQEVAGGEGRNGRLGYVAEATAKSDKPGGKGKRPTR